MKVKLQKRICMVLAVIMGVLSFGSVNVVSAAEPDAITVIPKVTFDSYSTVGVELAAGTNANISAWSAAEPQFNIQNNAASAGTAYANISAKSDKDKYFDTAYIETSGETPVRENKAVLNYQNSSPNAGMANTALKQGEQLVYDLQVHTGKKFYIYNRYTNKGLDTLFIIRDGKISILTNDPGSYKENNIIASAPLPDNQWVSLRVVYTAGDGVDGNGTDDTVFAQVDGQTAMFVSKGSDCVSINGVVTLPKDYLGDKSNRYTIDGCSVFDNFSVTKYTGIKYPSPPAVVDIMPLVDFNDWADESVAANALYSGNGKPAGEIFYAMNNAGTVTVKNRDAGDKYLVSNIGEFAYTKDNNPTTLGKAKALSEGEQMVVSFDAFSGSYIAPVNIRMTNDAGPTNLFTVSAGVLKLYDCVADETSNGKSGKVAAQYNLPKNRWVEVDLVYTRLGATSNNAQCDGLEVYINNKLVKPVSTGDAFAGKMIPLTGSVLDGTVSRFTFGRGTFDNIDAKHYIYGAKFTPGSRQTKTVVPIVTFDSYETAIIPVVTGDSVATADLTQWSAEQPILSIQNDGNRTGNVYVNIATKEESNTDKYFANVYNLYKQDGQDKKDYNVALNYKTGNNGALNNITLSEGEQLTYGVTLHSGKKFNMYNRTNGDADTPGMLSYLFKLENGKLYVFDGTNGDGFTSAAMGYLTLPENQWVDIRVVYTAGDGVDNNSGSGNADDTVSVYIGPDIQILTPCGGYSGNGVISSDGKNKLAADYHNTTTSRLTFKADSTFDNFYAIKHYEKEEKFVEEESGILGIDHQPNDFTYFHSERIMLGSKDYEFAKLSATVGNSYVIEPADKKNQYKGDRLIMNRATDVGGTESYVKLNIPTYGVNTDLIPYDRAFDYFLIEGMLHFTSLDLGGQFITLVNDMEEENLVETIVSISNGKISAGDGEKQLSIKDGSGNDMWHHIKVIVNVKDGCYDVVVDGELLCRDIGLQNSYQPLTKVISVLNQGIGELQIREMEITGLAKKPSLKAENGVYDFDITHTSQFIDDNLARTYLSDKVVFHGDGDMTYNRGTKTEYGKDSFVYDADEREVYVPLSAIQDNLDAEVTYDATNNQWVKNGTYLTDGPELEPGDVVIPTIDFNDWTDESVAANTKYTGNGKPANEVFYAMNNPGTVGVRTRGAGDKYLVNKIGEFAYNSSNNSNLSKISARNKGEQMVISFDIHPDFSNTMSSNVRMNNDGGPTPLFSTGNGKLNIYDCMDDYKPSGATEWVRKGTVIGTCALPQSRWSEIDLVYTRLGAEKDGAPCDSIEVYVNNKLVKLTGANGTNISGMVVPLKGSVLDGGAQRFTFGQGVIDNLGIKLYKNGEKFSTEEVKSYKYNREYLAPVRAIAQALGYEAEYYSYGKMVMIAQRGAELPESNDNDAKPWFDEQYYSYGWCVHGQTKLSDTQEISNFIFYDRPTAEQIKTAYYSKEQTHPRIVLTPDKVSEMRTRIAEDAATSAYAGVYTKALATIESKAKSILADGWEVVYDFDTDDEYRTLAHANDFASRAIPLGMAYMLTSDAQLKQDCADYVVKNLKIISTFPDFNYGHVIDAGVWLYGASLAFDWFYYEIDETERAEVAEGLLDIGLRPMNRTFYAMLPSALGRDSVVGPSNMGNANNYVKWKSNFIPYTQHGLVNASLVLAEYDEEVCFDTIEKCVRNWEYSNLGLYPAGGWLEGKSYLSVVHNNTAVACASLLNVLGDQYKILDAQGFEESIDMVLQLTSSTGSFCYADEGGYGGAMSAIPASTSFYANYYGRDDFELMRQWRYRHGDSGAWNWLDTVYYQHFDDQNLTYLDQAYGSMDSINYTEGTEIVTIHEDWANGNATFFALAGGPTRHYHFHNDGGDFNICMNGERWTHEMGTGNYNIGTNYSKYAGRAEGHNTIVLNPDEDPASNYGEGSTYGGYTWTAQKEQSMATVMDYGETDGGAFTTLDMTELYEHTGAQRVHRGAWLDKGYDVITIRDEIEFAEDDNFDGWWFMHTKASYEIIDDNTILLTSYGKKNYEDNIAAGRGATESLDGDNDIDDADHRIWWEKAAKKMYVQVQVDGADDYEVKMMPAVPLPSSPKIGNDPTNTAGINKVAVYYKGSGEIDVTVRMSPTLGDVIDTTPISQWTISDLYREGDDIRINLNGEYDEDSQLFVAEYKDREFIAAGLGDITYDEARGQYKSVVTPVTDDADECVLYLWNKDSYKPIRKLVRIRMSDLVIIE